MQSQLKFKRGLNTVLEPSAPYIHSLKARECMSPHSPGMGPRARSRSGTWWAPRTGPERQKQNLSNIFQAKNIAVWFNLLMQRCEELHLSTTLSRRGNTSLRFIVVVLICKLMKKISEALESKNAQKKTWFVLSLRKQYEQCIPSIWTPQLGYLFTHQERSLNLHIKCFAPQRERS